MVSSMHLPIGRIVVIAEMEDGTVRALDGEGSGLINVETHFRDRYLHVGPHTVGRTTTVTITYPGHWTMYTSRHPDTPAQREIEAAPKQVDP